MPGSRSAGDSRRRAGRPAIDPWRPLDVVVEEERRVDGRVERAATLFLAGSECPFSCVFCDLWRHTLESPTPPGALPRQIDLALEELGATAPCQSVKLYNASNFFDPAAVPEDDVEAIASRLDAFDTVVVESHPRLVGGRSDALARRLSGRLEVAMGLETVHPDVLPRLDKGMTLEDFETAVARLLESGSAVRAFVLVGVPYLVAEAQVEWAVRSVEHAVGLGVSHVSLIPMRGGGGGLERLADRGDWVPPRLADLELAVEACQALDGAVVTADTWDLGRLEVCPDCAPRRRQRLERINLSGEIPARRACAACGWS